MAKVMVEFVTVENTGNGVFTVTEDYQRQDGSRAKQYYKIWSKEQVSKGDTMHIEGLLSVKPSVDYQTGEERKWTDRNGKEHTSFEIHINNALISKIGRAVKSGNEPF